MALVKVAGGNLVGQMILFAASPVLSRLYSPDDFATYAIAFSASMVITPLVTLGFQGAIPIADDRTATKLVQLSCVCVCVVSSVLLLVQGPVRAGLRMLWGTDYGNLSTWQIIALAGLAGLAGILSGFLVRPKAYGPIARNVIAAQGLSAAAQIAMAEVRAGLGLILGVIIGRLVGVGGLAMHVRRLTRRQPASQTPGLAHLARRYWRFPVVFAPIAVIASAGGQVVLLLLPGIMNADELGQYAMASRILLFPVGVVSLAVAAVFLGELAEGRREDRDDAPRVFMRWTRLLTLAGVLVFAVGALGPVLAPWFLGPQWEVAGDYMRIMSLGVAVSAVASPLDHVWTVYERAWASAAWQVSRLAILISVLILADRENLSVDTTLWLVSFATAFIYSASWLSCWRIVRGSPTLEVDRRSLEE